MWMHILSESAKFSDSADASFATAINDAAEPDRVIVAFVIVAVDTVCEGDTPTGPGAATIASP